MKRFIYLVLVVAFIVALPVSHLVMASGPPGSRVCHKGRVIPAPSDAAVEAHEKHGDCVLYNRVIGAPCEEWGMAYCLGVPLLP